MGHSSSRLDLPWCGSLIGHSFSAVSLPWCEVAVGPQMYHRPSCVDRLFPGGHLQSCPFPRLFPCSSNFPFYASFPWQLQLALKRGSCLRAPWVSKLSEAAQGLLSQRVPCSRLLPKLCGLHLTQLCILLLCNIKKCKLNYKV